MSDKPIFSMTIREILDELEEINDLDCRCMTAPPWKRCASCVAGSAINNAADTLQWALEEARRMKP